MKKIFFLAIFIFFFTALISCKKDSDTASFTFPLQTGNYWEYIRIIKFTEPGSDSLSSFIPLCDTASVTMQITAQRTFADTARTYEFVAVLYNDNSHYQSTTFYHPRKNGLYRYAYKNAGAPVFPKQNQAISIRFRGKAYNSVSSLFRVLECQSPFAKTGRDSLIIEIPAPRVYKYPFKTGEQWTFIDKDDIRIAKQVSGKEKLELDCGTFSCYTVDWFYDFDNDGTWDEDITLTDYVNNKGLIYRKLAVYGIVFTDIHGEELGSKDFYETYTLTAFNL